LDREGEAVLGQGGTNMRVRTWVIPEGVEARTACMKSVMGEMLGGPTGYEVRIGPPDKSRAQRGKFHVLCEEIGCSFGYTPGEIKQFIKQYHYGHETRTVRGVVYTFLRSTEDDDKAQYSALIEAAMRWGAENGIEIEKM